MERYPPTRKSLSSLGLSREWDASGEICRVASAPEESIDPKEVFLGLAILILPPLILIKGAGLPGLILWPARALLFFVSMAFHIVSAAAVWGECALPYRSMSPVPGGPGMRPVAYHDQLQRRVGKGSGLDWVNWWAGLLLRGGTYLAVLVGGMVLALQWIPASWGSCGSVLGWDLAVVAAGLVAAPLLTLLMKALRGFWSKTEPPELVSQEPQGIGIARPSPSLQQRTWALFWRFTPLPALLLGLTALPMLLFPEQGLRLAGLGVAVAAVVGYPVWTWSDYLSRRYSTTEAS
jgi:hypothetical protein